MIILQSKEDSTMAKNKNNQAKTKGKKKNVNVEAAEELTPKNPKK